MSPNKGMKQTKPAQAMELRSLSPVLGGRSEVEQRVPRDVTFHPIGLDELQRFLFDVVDRPALRRQRHLEVSSDPGVQVLVRDLYDDLLHGMRVEDGDWDEAHPFSGNIRLAAAAIAGCLHPYSYAPASALSAIEDVDVRLLFRGFDQVGKGKIRSIGDFDPMGYLGIYDTLTASAFVPEDGILELERMLTEGHQSLISGLGEVGLAAIRPAIQYAREHGLGFVEASGLVVPGGRCLTASANLRWRAESAS